MYFNFPLFEHLATKAYRNVGGTDLSLTETLYIFEYYFNKYEQTFQLVHPNIRIPQIEKIINEMPYIVGIKDIYVDSDIYETLIDKHFKTQYRNCDYNINHFFSGDIRLMRYYEESYKQYG